MNCFIEASNGIKWNQPSLAISLYLIINNIMHIVMHIVLRLSNERRLLLTVLAYINDSKVNGWNVCLSRVFRKLIENLESIAIDIIILLDVIIAPLHLILKPDIRQSQGVPEWVYALYAALYVVRSLTFCDKTYWVSYVGT